MKIIKKISAFILVVIFMFLFVINSFAYELNQQYIYFYSDGTSVNYYLDNDENAYTFENGDKIYLALPLEHLKVTDESLISELKESLNNNELFIQPYYVPSSYVDLSLGSSTQASIAYNANNISFVSSSITTLSVLKFNSSHHYVCINTDITDKAFLAGNKVTLTYYYYNIYDDAWYNTRYEGVNCTGTFGYSLLSDFNACPYGRFAIQKYSNIYSCNVSIWTTWNRQT